MISDIDLINQVKTNNDSTALVELVERHTGIYQTVINRFSALPKIPASDLREDKAFNIYSWALKYDPARNMKFGTYVGNEARFMCLNLLNRTKESVEYQPDIEIDENAIEITSQAEDHDAMDMLEDRAKSVKDPRFVTIFNLKHRRGLSWREIGKEMGMSHEGARKIFNEYVGQLDGVLA